DFVTGPTRFEQGVAKGGSRQKKRGVLTTGGSDAVRQTWALPSRTSRSIWIRRRICSARRRNSRGNRAGRPRRSCGAGVGARPVVVRTGCTRVVRGSGGRRGHGGSV